MFFKGCNFFVLAEPSATASVKHALRDTGATLSYMMSTRVTHFLIGGDVNDVRGDLRLEKAASSGAVVLKVDYVFECVRQGKRLDEQRFRVLKTISSSSSSSSGVSASAPQRALRVFVSGTFRDLEEERSALATRVFPSLESRCAERGVFFGAVDLRWGVEGGGDTQDTVAQCLKRVCDCQFLIVLLGSRIGFVPDDNVIGEAQRAFPHAELRSGMSITELECRVFASAHSHDHIFAFARTEAGSSSSLFREWLRPRAFRDVEDLLGLVRETLSATIERECPPLPERRGLSDLDAHLEREETFFRSLEALSGGDTLPEPPAYLRRTLDAHLRTKPSHPLVVSSEVRGGGVSVALASWMHRADKEDTSLVWLSSFTETSFERVIRVFLLQLQRHFGWESSLSVPTEHGGIDTLLLTLTAWLRAAASLGRGVVVVVDGLQSSSDNVRQLCTLPDLPKGVVVILGCDETLQRVFHERWPDPAATVTVAAMTSQETVDFCVRYLDRFGKQLSESQRALIGRTSVEHRTPLHMVLVMEITRIFASFESVQEELERLVNAPLNELEQTLLEKWEQSFGEKLVAAVFGAIASSRSGMTLLDLSALVSGTFSTQWRELLHAARRVLLERGGRLSFVHSSFGVQCRARYGSHHAELLALYQSLNKASDICFHAAAQGDGATLKRAIMVPAVFCAISDDERHFYARVAGIDAAALRVMQTRCADPVLQSRVASSGGQLLLQAGEFVEATALLRDACRLAPALGLAYEARATILLGECLLAAGNASEATVQASRVMQLCGNGNADAFSLWEALSLQSRSREKLGELESALTSVRAAIDAAARVHSEGHPVLAELMVQEANVQRKLGHFSVAQASFVRAEVMLVRSFGREHPALLRCLRGQALCAKKLGRYVEASRLYQICLRLVDQSHGPLHPLRSKLLGDLADAQRKLEDYFGALETYHSALELLQRGQGAGSIEEAELHHGIALAKKKLGDYEAAETSENCALHLVESLYGRSHYKYGVSLGALADIQRKKGSIQQALASYHQARSVLRTTLEETHEEVAMIDLSIALCEKKLAQYDRAKDTYRRAICNLIASFGEGHYKVGIALSQLADVLRKRKDKLGALALYNRAESVLTACVGANNSEIADVLLGKGVLLIDMRRFSEALAEFERGLDVVERRFGFTSYKRGLFMNRLGEVLLAQGKLTHASFKFEEALRILTVSLGPLHVEVADVLLNVAATASSASQRREALLKARGIVLSELGLSHPKLATVDARLSECAE